MKSKFSIPIVFVSELPMCEQCGCPLSEPGLCSSCAEKVVEVAHVTRVSIPLENIWKPEELQEP